MEKKKNPRKNVYRLTHLWFNVGLVLSLLIIISAFEWRSKEIIQKIDVTDLVTTDDNPVIPITDIKPPPPPKPKLPKPVAVPNEVEVDPNLPEIIFDPEEIKTPVPVDIEPLPDDDTNEIIDFAEQQPAPIGGYEAFYKFISKNMKYPRQAISLGVEGKVYVQFVVNKEGNITDIKIVRGIGAGCDEEVIRLMEKAPKWTPGKQRAKPVNVRMLIPIHFKLQ